MAFSLGTGENYIHTPQANDYLEIYGNITTTASTSGTYSNIIANGSNYVGVTASGIQGVVLLGGTFAPASQSTSFVALTVAPTINQTSTASGNYTGILVNATETAFLGTTARLLDLQVGGTTQFNVDHKGNVFLTAAAGAPTSAGTAGTAGQVLYFGGFLYLCTVTGVSGSATWTKISSTSV